MELYKKRISDLGRIVTGKTPRTSNAQNYGGDIPFLTPSDDLSGKFAPKTVKTITELGLSEVRNCLLPSKSVCVSCIGSDLGKVVITNEPTVTNQQFNSIIPTEENDTDFIYYLMTIVGKELNFLSKTSTAVPIINKSTFADYEIEMPSLENQRRIAKVLSSLDDKIEVNRRINDNLEQQAQALFKHWFVDFAPFKDGKFVESELGMIPEGWRVGILGDIADFKRGNTIKKSDTKDGSIPVVAGGLEPAYYHNQSNTSSRVITISGSGANAGFTRMYYQPVWASDCSYADNATTSFLHTAYCYLITNKKKVDALQWGAAQPHVYAKDINKLPFAIAPIDVLTHFEELISEMFDLIEVNDKENKRLYTLRDTLLPKLMSGQIKL